MFEAISGLVNILHGNSLNKSSAKASDEETEALLFENEGNGVNGEIDEAVYQGDYGDCWLISAILSMSYTESGAQVIKDSISLNPDGSVDISFAGADKKYAVSEDELEKYNMPDKDKDSGYSTGDDDMLAIELGIEAIVADKTVKTKYSIQDGGNPYYVYKLFDADNVKITGSKKEIKDAFNYFENNKETCSMTLGVVDKSVCGLKANHGYAVKNIDKDTVTIIDPWDSTEEIEVSKKELMKNSNNLSVVYAEFEAAA